MNNLIDKYLTLLDVAASLFPEDFWYCTSLSSKNRFSLSSRNLIKKLSESENDNTNLLDEALGEEKATLWIKLALIGAMCKTVAGMLIKSLRYQRPTYWKNLIQESKDVVLIKSFLFESDIDKNKDFDTYFGRVPYLLKNEKYTPVVLSDCIGKDRLLANYENSKINFLSIHSFIEPWEVITLFLKLVCKGLRADGWVSKELLKNTTFVNAFYQLVFEKVLSSLRVKKIFYTFENNPWEKILIIKAKEFGIPCWGFQHVPFAPSALNYYFTEKEKAECFPDKIITTGKVPAEILVNKYEIPSSQVIVGYGFRFKELQKQAIKKKEGKKILVGLEGVSNCVFLVNYILRNNTYFKDNGYQITFRFHPAFKIENMRPFIERQELISQSHIKISSSTLQDDFKENDILFYWGSTVSFEALNYGLWLVNLSPEGEMLSNDQLWNYFSTRIAAKESIHPEELMNKLNVLRTDQGSSQSEGQVYLSQYLTSWCDSDVARWIQENVSK